MRELGEIVRIDNNRGIVKLNPKGGCPSCGLNGFCHATGTGDRELSLPLHGKTFQPGDFVEIDTSSRSLLTAAFTVFILPLILSVGGYSLVWKITASQNLSVLAFFVTFGVAEGVVMILDRIIGRRRFFEPQIVRKVDHVSEFIE